MSTNKYSGTQTEKNLETAFANVQKRGHQAEAIYMELIIAHTYTTLLLKYRF